MTLETDQEKNTGLEKKFTPDLPPLMPREELVAKAHLLMADVLVAQGLKEKAIKYLDDNSSKIVGEENQLQKSLTQAETLLDLLVLDHAEEILTELDSHTLDNNPQFLLLRGILKKQKNTRFISNQTNTVPIEVIDLIEKSITLSEGQKQLTQAAVARTYLGQMFVEIDPQRAIAYLEKAYEQATSVGNAAIRGKTLQALARCYTKLNDFDKAQPTFEQATQIFLQNKQTSAYGNTLVFMALAKEKQADATTDEQSKNKILMETREIYELAIAEMEKTEAGKVILEKNLYRVYGKFMLPIDINIATKYILKAEDLQKPNSPLTLELEQLMSAAIARAL